MSCTAYLYTRFTKLSREDCETDFKKEKKNHVKSVAVLNSKGSLGLENRSPQAELTAMRVLTLALLPPKNYIAGNIRN